MKDSLYHFMKTVVSVVGGFLVTVIGLRIIFKLLALNPLTPVVAWIYSVSDTLIVPFHGLLPDLILTPNSSLDITAFIAIIAYKIVLTLLERLFESVFHPIVVDTHEYDSADRLHVHRHVHE